MEIETLLLEIRKENQDTHEKLFNEVAKIREAQAVISQRTEDNHKTLNGNGKLGLAEQHQQDTNELNSKIDKNMFKVIVGFIIVGAGGTGSGVMFFRMLASAFKFGGV